MKMSIVSISLGLVGIIFICIFAGSASSSPQLDAKDQLNKFKENTIHSLGYDKGPEWGVLKAGEDTIYFPWHGSSLPGRAAFPKSASICPAKEVINLDANNSSASLDDLLVINSVKERDVNQRSSQEGDPEDMGLSNALMIDVGGSGQETDASNYEADNIEAGRPSLTDGDLRYAGNYLTVNVHDITVSAVNSMPDGNAVATSNIIIEPVQTIVIPSEVNQKLC